MKSIVFILLVLSSLTACVNSSTNETPVVKQTNVITHPKNVVKKDVVNSPLSNNSDTMLQKSQSSQNIYNNENHPSSTQVSEENSTSEGKGENNSFKEIPKEIPIRKDINNLSITGNSELTSDYFQSTMAKMVTIKTNDEMDRFINSIDVSKLTELQRKDILRYLDGFIPTQSIIGQSKQYNEINQNNE